MMTAGWQLLVVPMLMATVTSHAQDGPTGTPSSVADAQPPLLLSWIDAEQILRETSGLSAEVVQVFDSIGVRVEWRIYRGRHAPRTNELFVHLRTAEPVKWQLERRSMGVVFTRGETQRRLYVFFRSLARTLGYDPRELRALLKVRDDRNFERALSRVIVHEAVHALAPELPHAPSGVTRSLLTRRELISLHERIDPSAVDAFRGAVTKLHLQTAVLPADAVQGEQLSRVRP